MTFNLDEWRDQMRNAESGQEIYDLVMKLPDRSHIDIATERGYTGQEAQDYADMLEWDAKIDLAASKSERIRLMEQLPDRIKALWANFNHPT